jgi:hypothetical protein
MAQKDMPASRERRLRRAAARMGLALRKVARGRDRGRYRLIDPEFGSARSSQSRTHPISFSLEEAVRGDNQGEKPATIRMRMRRRGRIEGRA